MLATVATAAIVSFVVASALLKFGRGADADAALPGGADVTAPVAGAFAGTAAAVNGRDVRKLIIACDAGMGSSVMVASTMRKKLAQYGVEVAHTPVDQIPADAQVVLTQEGLAPRAAKTAPQAVIVPFTNYMGDPAFDRLEQAVAKGHDIGAGGVMTPVAASVSAPAGTAPTGTAPAGTAPAGAPVVGTPAAATASAPARRAKKRLDPRILPRENVRLGLSAANKEDAIRQAGQVLVACGAAEPAYIDGMLARELQTSTFLGNGVTIPHGTNESRAHIKAAALGFLQFPDGVDWDGKVAHVVIPIASNSDEHVSILSALATTLADPANAERLRTASSIDEVLDLMAPEEE